MAFYSQWTALTPTPLVSKYAHQMLMLQKVLLINFFYKIPINKPYRRKKMTTKKGDLCNIHVFMAKECMQVYA